MPKGRQAELWDEAYRRGRFHWQDPDASLDAFLEAFRSSEGLRVLDHGCGRGRHLIRLEERRHQAIGLDFSQVALAGARKELEDRALPTRLVQADMAAVPIAESCLDAVISFHVIHHGTWAEIHRNLKEVRRVLGDGGQALVTFLSDKPPRFGEGERIDRKTFVLKRGADAGIPHRLSPAKR